MKLFFRILAWAAGAALAAASSHAQDPRAGPVASHLEQYKVVRLADGGEGRAPADSAKPGDVIEYVVTYRNTAPVSVRNLEATLPIPVHTEFVAGSARPAGAQASVDSREYAAIPLKRVVRREGRRIEEAIPYREYRYLRWGAGELAGGESASFSARVRVVDDLAGGTEEKGNRNK